MNMNLNLGMLGIGFAVLLTPLRLYAATFYVAPNGNDQSTGAMDQPFATMGQAQTAAKAGDTVYFRAGTYTFDSATAANGVLLSKSGQSGARINYWAYQGEVPVFDFSGMTAQARITGLRVTASWIHLKGFEVKGVPQILTTQHESWGIYNTGSNNIYELINTHHHMGPGLFIAQGGNNLVLNCDSHHNYDPKSSTGPGTNADGFGCHIDAGQTGNVIRGCRAWYNTDDGYDLISASEAVIIENSWAWLNGYLPDTMTLAADGNGFKAGGYGVPATGAPANPPSHTVRFCLSFQNKAAGFYQNHHPVADHFYNNTSFNNRSSNYNLLGLDANVGILKNNLAYKGTAVSNGTGAGVDDAGNSWNLAVMVSDADFVSVSPTGIDGPRKADGSLPDIGFMHLQTGSDLIDKGQNVQLPFNDAAPDLGAFETGPPLGTGGAAGSMGAAGGAGIGVGAGGANGGVAGGMATGAGGSNAAGGGDNSGGANGVGSGSSGADGSGSPGNPSSGGSLGATSNDAGAEGGCSCRAAGGGGALPSSSLLSLVMVAGWRRRRRLS
jgi:Right handed beta helix region